MRHGRWACCERGLAPLLAAWLLLAAGMAWWPPAVAAADGQAIAPTHADLIVTDSPAPPAGDDPRWQPRPLAQDEPGRSAWYRVRFDAPATGPDGPLVLYLPYFYGGGRILLNGALVAEVPHTTATLRVRWERPLLLLLPPAALQAQGNLLLVQVHAEHQGSSVSLPRLEVGGQNRLQPVFERRLLVVRTLPILTWVAGSVVGLLVIFIWLRRRDEVLYGLFGLAALLWAQRTSTFVLDALPTGTWEAWRLVYLLCTGGFVLVMTLFVLNLAGWSRRGVTRALLAYGAIGPVVFLAAGEGPLMRAWTAGLLLVGLGMAAVAVWAAWRQRSGETVAIAVAVVLGVAAGVHDQLVATRSPLVMQWLPGWGDHHLFLLHHAANLLLLVMGVLLALRFVRSLHAVEEANRTLEDRVRQREGEIAVSYQRIAALQREQAATDERQRIMRDLHDGLGSQLFTSLSRAERGALDSGAMADTLRGAIDQMRVAIEALASEDQDLDATFGNFRFRWDARLRDAGITPTWDIALPDTPPGGTAPLGPHDALQLLHIIQEALTNVLKHARASQVAVRVAFEGTTLAADITDDGQGAGPPPAAGTGGRGRANMRNRAQRLGGQIEWHAGQPGTRVSLRAARGVPGADPPSG